MPKLFWFQFCPADWRRDTGCLTPATRGVWMDILCAVWPSGERTMPLDSWARELRVSASECQSALDEIVRFQIADVIPCNANVTLCNADVTIASRRMKRDVTKRELTRLRVIKHRETQKLQECNTVELKSELELKKEEEETLSRCNAVTLRANAQNLLAFLNEKTGRKFRAKETTGKDSINLTLILTRLKSGATPQDCRAIIARKVRDWGADPKMRAYLRPSTLFGKEKFEQYLGEVGSTKEIPHA